MIVLQYGLPAILPTIPVINHFNQGSLLHFADMIKTMTINNTTVTYIPLHGWLPLLTQFGLIDHIKIKANASTSHYRDIITGSWFTEFLA